MKRSLHFFYRERKGLGNRYKKRLSLEKHEVDFLNRIWYAESVFFKIPLCGNQVIRLFLRLMSELKCEYEKENERLEQSFFRLAKTIVDKEHANRKGPRKRKASKRAMVQKFYVHILRKCENGLRSKFKHKRKLPAHFYLKNEEARQAFKEHIEEKVDAILIGLINNIEAADPATEIQLNTLNPNRWKEQLKEIMDQQAEQAKPFIACVYALFLLNRTEKNIEKIFLQAIKHMGKSNLPSVLKLYIYLIDAWPNTQKPSLNLLPAPWNALIFNSLQKKSAFEEIQKDFSLNRDFTQAFSQIDALFGLKQKNIRLNAHTIQLIQQQHSGTVALLNAVLIDDLEAQIAQIQSNNPDQTSTQLGMKPETANGDSPYIEALNLSPIQIRSLELFRIRKLFVSAADFQEFAKSNGVFLCHLIESINEQCFEIIDDVLIEEESDCYSIIPNYFKKIVSL